MLYFNIALSPDYVFVIEQMFIVVNGQIVYK